MMKHTKYTKNESKVKYTKKPTVTQGVTMQCYNE